MIFVPGLFSPWPCAGIHLAGGAAIMDAVSWCATSIRPVLSTEHDAGQADSNVASLGTQMRSSRPNEPAAGKAGFGARKAIGPHFPGCLSRSVGRGYPARYDA